MEGRTRQSIATARVPVSGLRDTGYSYSGASGRASLPGKGTLTLHPKDTQAKEGAQLPNSSDWSVGLQHEAGTLEPECSRGPGHRPEALRRMTRGPANLKELPGPGDRDSGCRCSPRPGLGLSHRSRGTAAWLPALRGHPSRVQGLPVGSKHKPSNCGQERSRQRPAEGPDSQGGQVLSSEI